MQATRQLIFVPAARCSRLFVVVAAVLLAACAQQDDEQPATAVPPTETSQSEEFLRAAIPDGWLQLRKTETDQLTLAEYIPADSTETWQQKLSIEAMKGDDLPDPLLIVEGLSAEQSELCEKFFDRPVFAGYENGFETVVSLFECQNNNTTGKPLVTILKLIRADEHLYIITRIWRLEKNANEDGTLPISAAEIAAWSDALGRVTVCNPSDDDHPCEIAPTRSPE